MIKNPDSVIKSRVWNASTILVKSLVMGFGAPRACTLVVLSGEQELHVQQIRLASHYYSRYGRRGVTVVVEDPPLTVEFKQKPWPDRAFIRHDAPGGPIARIEFPGTPKHLDSVTVQVDELFDFDLGYIEETA